MKTILTSHEDISKMFEKEESPTNIKTLTPRQIVDELNKYIVGQEEAKKCVAIAIRNRWRRQQLPPELRDEVAPKNIIMIGPTGIGKTEIARRLANLVNAPFLKVEASRYTEVGYHGRDVESMVRDLLEIAVSNVRQEHSKKIASKAEKNVEEKLLDLLLPSLPESPSGEDMETHLPDEVSSDLQERRKRSRERMRTKLRSGKLDKQMVEIQVEDRTVPMVEIFSNASIEQMGIDIQNVFDKIIPGRHHTKKVTVQEARNILMLQESENLIDKEQVIKEAIELTENMGIIFIDEIDKIAGSEYKYGPDVSREGVQRDLLPIIEGATVLTRYGMIKTDHILFISAGAFNVSKPSDLIPEMQGRFPIRVELKPLSSKDFERILQEPQNALIKQYQALMKTEGITLEFEPDSIAEIAQICEMVNQKLQNIGARRLHTIMEKLVEEISFHAPDLEEKKIVITAKMVREKMTDIIKDEDLSRYIL